MTNELTKTFSFTPTSLKEAMEYADLISKSTIIPKAYQGKSGDILVAIQMGAELGLKPIQSLQNIAVINGKPSVYGDALLALVQSTPIFEDIKEYYDEELKAAVCIIKRKNQSEHKVIFSEEDAKKAGLWGKLGPWQTYPKRMLQMRARGFALRDKFSDALGGLITAEEAHDYSVEETKNVTPTNKVETLNSKIDKLIENNKVESTSVENCDASLLTNLCELINKYSIPSETIDKWFKKANVSSLDQLSNEQLQAAIDYIKNKYEEIS